MTNKIVDLDDPLCLCFHVSKRKIVNYIRVHRPRRASQVSGCGGAGTGCGWCIPYLQRIFQELTEAGELAPDELTPQEYAQGRKAHIQSGRGTPPPGATPIDDP